MIKSLRDARQQYYGIINHNYALLLIYSMALKCEYFSYKTPRKSGARNGLKYTLTRARGGGTLCSKVIFVNIPYCQSLFHSISQYPIHYNNIKVLCILKLKYFRDRSALISGGGGWRGFEGGSLKF